MRQEGTVMTNHEGLLDHVTVSVFFSKSKGELLGRWGALNMGNDPV